MPPTAVADSTVTKGALEWRPTKIMNMRDLSKDDDFLSHLLVEKLGTGTVPLLVHKMDSSRRLPKTDAQQLLQIVRRLVVTKSPVQQVTRQAVDELLLLPAIRYYLKSYTQKQINAFATHASRYFELYHPSGSIEIAHTSRYSHHTGKSELCILATRFLAPGAVITELKGSMANLTDEEDRELKRTDLRNSDIRRDFSVIHSKQMKKNHLFLGPARFVNHDCNNNCELFREGKYITFRVLRPIAIGEEITAHYGDGYFGRKNRHCLCETCEKNGRGGYAEDHHDDDSQPNADPGSDSNSDTDSDTSTSSSEAEGQALLKVNLNVNERRTRRGVYAILAKKEQDSDESEEEEDNTIPLANAKDIPADGEMELTASELTSQMASRAQTSSVVSGQSSNGRATLTPVSGLISRASSSLSSVSSPRELSSTRASSQSTSFRSIISTRRQKAQAMESGSNDSQLATPPLSRSAVSPASLNTPSGHSTVSISSSDSRNYRSVKGKEKAITRNSTPSSSKPETTVKKDDVKVKKEEAEPRVLRTRPSTVTVPDISKDPPAPPQIPIGQDGKPLPVCATCSNVLPVISVDSKVVWGLGLEGAKKRKRQDCPRCIRHFAIYAQPWPCRVPPHGFSFLPTPKEEATHADTTTKRVTQKVLPVLDRKLAAAVSASGRGHKIAKAREDQPNKRQKMDTVSHAVTSGTTKKTSSNQIHGRPTVSAPPGTEVVKRKRGRPRLSSLPRKPLKMEDPDTEQNRRIMKQPRNTNGRFERKVSHPKLGDKPTAAAGPTVPSSRAERALERGKAKGDSEQDSSAANGKRPGEDALDDPPHKRRRTGKDVEPVILQRVLPRPASSFRGGRLFSKPNPLSYALQAWGGPVVLDESSSEDERQPVTPEDNLSPPGAVVDINMESHTHPSPTFSPPPVLPIPALTFKPSPGNFARRRWASASASPSCDGEPEPDPPATAQQIAPEHKGDPKSAHLQGEDERYLTISPLSSGEVSRYKLWSQAKDMYLSDEELSDISLDGMSPISDSYISDLSSCEDDNTSATILQGPTYPLMIGEPTLSSTSKSHPLTARQVITSPPNLIRAGWDTCSEMSDASCF